MSLLTPERLYRLLPVVYRVRDEEQGQPLRALLQSLGVTGTLVAAVFPHLGPEMNAIVRTTAVATAAAAALAAVPQAMSIRTTSAGKSLMTARLVRS